MAFKIGKGWLDVHAEAKKLDEFSENFAVAKKPVEENFKVKVSPQHDLSAGKTLTS